MNTITKPPNIPTRQAYCQPTLQTRELDSGRGVTQSGPWAMWVWLQLGWAKKSSDLPVGVGPIFCGERRDVPLYEAGATRHWLEG